MLDLDWPTATRRKEAASSTGDWERNHYFVGHGEAASAVKVLHT